jgi:hypothetical protein
VILSLLSNSTKLPPVKSIPKGILRVVAITKVSDISTTDDRKNGMEYKLNLI